MPRTPVKTIRVVLAALNDHQKDLVIASLERANTMHRNAGGLVEFSPSVVTGRGIHILKEAANADVAVLGLDDEVLPGEASHVLASYPEVKIIGVDSEACPRIVVGAVTESLSADLPTVIRWITRPRRQP